MRVFSIDFSTFDAAPSSIRLKGGPPTLINYVEGRATLIVLANKKDPPNPHGLLIAPQKRNFFGLFLAFFGLNYFFKI